MTSEQREKIQELRGQGYGYATIASAIGLSKDSVKAYCRKHNLGGVVAKTNARIDLTDGACLNCGKLLVQTPGRKRLKFCCSQCRIAWWNTHPEVVRQKAVYTPVLIVAGPLRPMETPKESIAPMPAILRPVSKPVIRHEQRTI